MCSLEVLSVGFPKHGNGLGESRGLNQTDADVMQILKKFKNPDMLGMEEPQEPSNQTLSFRGRDCWQEKGGRYGVTNALVPGSCPYVSSSSPRHPAV